MVNSKEAMPRNLLLNLQSGSFDGFSSNSSELKGSWENELLLVNSAWSYLN